MYYRWQGDETAALGRGTATAAGRAKKTAPTDQQPTSKQPTAQQPTAGDGDNISSSSSRHNDKDN